VHTVILDWLLRWTRSNTLNIFNLSKPIIHLVGLSMVALLFGVRIKIVLSAKLNEKKRKLASMRKTL